MQRSHILSLSLAGTAALAALALAPGRARAQVLSGFDVYRANCGGCHELYDPDSPKRSRKEWETILTRMVNERGAALTKEEFAAVLGYLDSFNRPPRRIEWVDALAKSHRAALRPADAGKLPPEWVDLTIGSEEQVPWAVQTDAAGKSAYLSPLKSAGENQFPLLVDNSGIMLNGRITARLQILSGKGAVGAGVLFGFRSPQEYFAVRLGPGDALVYQVRGGERALLARAPLATPLRQWRTLAVDLSGTALKVAVDGKPIPALARTLEDYRGGRAGLQTQGDTLALFDQWEVEVRDGE